MDVLKILLPHMTGPPPPKTEEPLTGYSASVWKIRELILDAFSPWPPGSLCLLGALLKHRTPVSVGLGMFVLTSLYNIFYFPVSTLHV